MARRRKTNPWNVAQKRRKLLESYEEGTGASKGNAMAGLERRRAMKATNKEADALKRRKEMARAFLDRNS